MQYFQALKIGQVRIKDATAKLKQYTGTAMPAIALKEMKDNIWEPVGEEYLAGLVEGQHGYMVCLCDKDGNAKAIATWFKKEDADRIVEKMKSDGLDVYVGKIKIPL